MKRPAALLVLLLSPFAGYPASTQPVVTLPPVSTITFTPGSIVTTTNGRLTPGGRDLYYVAAKAGQTLLVSVAAEGNVTFQVYPPETTLAKAADGRPLITGKALYDSETGLFH